MAYKLIDAAARAELGLAWAEELASWLEGRGYQIRESGQFNPATGRGRDSEFNPCEYKRGHVRVRINPGGIILLRDPGCTLQVHRPASRGMWEQWSPNAGRLDRAPWCRIPDMICAIEHFEARPAYTPAEAQAAYR